MPPASIQLEIRRPGNEPRWFPIPPGVYSVGSDADCRIRLEHEQVDNRHAVLTVRENGCSVEDLASKSGTMVAGTPVHGRADVLSGQDIAIGLYVLRVHFAAAAPPAPPPPSMPIAAPPPAAIPPPAAPVAPAHVPVKPPGASARMGA